MRTKFGALPRPRRQRKKALRGTARAPPAPNPLSLWCCCLEDESATLEESATEAAIVSLHSHSAQGNDWRTCEDGVWLPRPSAPDCDHHAARRIIGNCDLPLCEFTPILRCHKLNWANGDHDTAKINHQTCTAFGRCLSILATFWVMRRDHCLCDDGVVQELTQASLQVPSATRSSPNTLAIGALAAFSWGARPITARLCYAEPELTTGAVANLCLTARWLPAHCARPVKKFPMGQHCVRVHAAA